MDRVLEALDIHENSFSVLTVLGVKASSQRPADIPAVQYYTATATQINDFVTSLSVDELRVLAEPCKLISNISDEELYYNLCIVFSFQWLM